MGFVSVGSVFFSKGLGDLLCQVSSTVVRPKFDDAGVPELANIYRFFEGFPGIDLRQPLAAVFAEEVVSP